MPLNTDIQSIKIGYSCQQDWQAMSAVDSNKYCQSCNKIVIDFSRLSDEEILQYFEKQQGKKSCGYFNEQQLRSLNKRLASPSNTSFLKPLILSTLISTSACHTPKDAHKSCTTTLSHYELLADISVEGELQITGSIVDENHEPMIGANITLQQPLTGVSSDKNGQFKLSIPKSADSTSLVSVEYTGYPVLNIQLLDIQNKHLKITMLADLRGSLGDVVIIRKPWYKRLWHKIFK